MSSSRWQRKQHIYTQGRMGWNYKSQSEPASMSQQEGSSQGFGGASRESVDTAVANRESWGGGESKGVDKMVSL